MHCQIVAPYITVHLLHFVRRYISLANTVTHPMELRFSLRATCAVTAQVRRGGGQTGGGTLLELRSSW